jgi:hypothetical protein
MGKRNNKKRNKAHGHHALFGNPAAVQSYKDTAKDGLFILVAAIAAGGAGAAIGKHSLLAGLPLTFYGIHNKNKYLIAAGLGLTLSNGFQKPGGQSTTTQGIDGFDFKQFASDAKDRVGTFFQNFSEKLYLPKKAEQQSSSEQTTEGVGDDGVTYFINPYKGTGDLDMSELDKIQSQIAEMNKQGNLNDVEREF